MKEILDNIEEYKKILELLGYKLDIKKGDIPMYRPANILSNHKIVGTLSLDRVNLYYLYHDKKTVGNIDLKNTTFYRDKSKNERLMFHIKLKDKNIKMDCYNAIVNSKNDFIKLKDDNLIIKFRNDILEKFQYLSKNTYFLALPHENGIRINYSDDFLKDNSLNFDIKSVKDIEETYSELNKKLNTIIGNDILKNLVTLFYCDETKEHNKIYKYN